MKIVLRVLFWFFVLVALLLLVASGFAVYNARDKHSGYNLDLILTPAENPQMKVGFSSLVANPEVPDRWTDSDGDNAYNPKKGDTFVDGNGNGEIDPIYLGGFLKPGRIASDIHDDLMVSTMVIGDGVNKVAIVAVDQTGFTHDLPITVRAMLPPELGIHYVLIHATHTHSAPDIIGLWGKNLFTSGLVGGNQRYYDHLKNQIVLSIKEATHQARPAVLRFYEDPDGAEIPVSDNRKPIIKDNALRLIEAVDQENGKTLGMLVQWNCHPITSGAQPQVTSDFCHYLRKGVKEGLYLNGQLMEEGINAPVIYMNGCLGGHASAAGQTYKAVYTDSVPNGSFERTQAQGEQLAKASLLLRKAGEYTESAEGIALRAKTFNVKMDNPIFYIGTFMGLMNSGMSGWFESRTEMAAIKIGPASFATFPGELYPEIANGGVESPENADYGIESVEAPSVRALMNNKYNFVFSLVNDCIGYIVPKSQWDAKAPYTYEYKSEPYGEMVSFGPETAPTLYKEIKQLIGELK